MVEQTIINVKDKIRDVVDFPKKGIVFRDITTALKDAETLKVMIDYLCEQFKDVKIDYIAGIESRGFIFGMPMAYKLNAGFVPIRKPNKLPAATYSEEYALEYGTDKIPPRPLVQPTIKEVEKILKDHWKDLFESLVKGDK